MEYFIELDGYCYLNVRTGRWVLSLKDATGFKPYNPLRFLFMWLIRQKGLNAYFRKVVYVKTKQSLSERLYRFLVKGK